MVLRPQPKPKDRRDFAEFERHGRKWLQRFGLTDWNVRFDLEAIDGSSDTRMATIWFNVEVRKATITLKFGLSEPRWSSLDSLALHEVIHLSLGDLASVCTKRGEQHEDSIREEHKLIERLIPLLLGEEGG